MYGMISGPGTGSICPRVRLDIDVVPWGTSRHALALLNPAEHQSSDGGRLSTPFGAVSTRGITVFVPRVLELQMCGGISDLGMGNYTPLLRRVLDVVPRGSRCALAP